MSVIEIVDYDQIAMSYYARIQDSSHKRVLKALRAILSDVLPKCVSELGCGTSHWLKGLESSKQWLQRTNLSNEIVLSMQAAKISEQAK